MQNFDENMIINGTNGTLWLDNEVLANLKSIEIKVAGTYEDIAVCGNWGTNHTYNGWNGEGTLVLHKVESQGLKLLAEKFKTGETQRFKIITKLSDLPKKRNERIAITNVKFTEFILTKFEAHTVLEEELPFKFSDYEIIETMN